MRPGAARPAARGGTAERLHRERGSRTSRVVPHSRPFSGFNVHPPGTGCSWGPTVSRPAVDVHPVTFQPEAFADAEAEPE